MGSLGILCAADSIARVAAAIEAEEALSHALWAEENSRIGPVVGRMKQKLNAAARQVQPGDIELWQVFSNAAGLD